MKNIVSIKPIYKYLILFFFCQNVLSQNPVNILQSNTLDQLLIHDTIFQKFSGNVIVEYEDFKIICDTILIDEYKEAIRGWGNVNIANDTIEFQTDSIKGMYEYFDDKGKNLRRAFLLSPVQFSRISSRYNLRRKIAYYGKIRPHYGTDFAAPVGTPIRSTAAGRVTKSGYTRGNGYYVTVKHNATYSTQYLHMRKRGLKVGSYVEQGDKIGEVGMTGYTSGPHVCYRFWKNGKQVDPLKQKLPEAKPISDILKEKYLTYMYPLKLKLDSMKSNLTFDQRIQNGINP